MTQLRALIFDVDGTLAETERYGHRVAFNLAFRDVGLDWDWDVSTYGELLRISGGKERIRYYLDRYDVTLPYQEDLNTFISDLHKRKTHHFLRLLAMGNIPLRAGVVRLLTEARQAGLSLAIATTTSPENVTALIRATLGEKAVHWFKVIAAGDMVAAKKPAPDVYQFVLDGLAIGAEHCIAIEDSSNGLLAARGANIETVITVNDYTRRHNFEDALLVIDTIGEPDQPFEVLQGSVGRSHYLTIDLLNDLRD